MNSQEYETLSAMLDNEADELELRRVVRNAGESPELTATWERMNLVQALIHDDNLKASGSVQMTGNRLADAVAGVIEADDLPRSAVARAGQWSGALAKLAVAASVAVAFLVGMQISVENPDAVPVAGAEQVEERGIEATGEAAGAAAMLASEATAETRQVNPEARQRLEEYIRSASITREQPTRIEQLEDSPLYRLVNEIEASD